VAVPKLPISLDRDFARIADPMVERVAQDSCLEHLRKLPSSELEALIYCTLRCFSRSLAGESGQISACAALTANLCFVRSVPLFEASCLLYALRDSVAEIDKLERLRIGTYTEPNGPDKGGTGFFDLLVFELLKGY
jgi:hypothetical protein